MLISFEEFTQKFRPCNAESWEEAWNQLDSDIYETMVVADLKNELQTHGCFTDPVRVSASGEVVDGMHRLKAYSELKDAKVDYTTNLQEERGSFYARFKILGVNDADDETFDVVFGVLRSFPSSRGWISADFLSFTKGVAGGVWKTDVSQEVFKRLLQERAHLKGWELEFLEVSKV